MFYTFYQNNSGGYFHRDENVADYVIIEAGSVEDANDRAVDIGVYFHGVENGLDCDCCGDRWYRVWYKEGANDEPKIYDYKPENYVDMFAQIGDIYCVVHYKDGSRKHFRKHANQIKENLF